MAHGNAQCTKVLPTILMGFLRLLGKFFCPFKPSADSVTFVGRLRESMQYLLPPTTRHHGHHTIFVSKDFAICSHVFLRTDFLKKGLQSPYEGPYKVFDRTEKVFWILSYGKEFSMRIDSLKPLCPPNPQRVGGHTSKSEREEKSAPSTRGSSTLGTRKAEKNL
ncbi:uncharacterized protein NPIL_270861 [Nephila pilipes]|uniref:Uncharacterized protein n=1 Tax=Nephila pilipes TaxID=299642 RepID=A0A8X6IFA4_NEPPI|nr:uncharacterized protein NPIL_270861 [Nephila pilipes]